jgi:flagellar FliL protein
MAEKNENEAKQKKSPKMLIIIIAAVALAAGGGYFAMGKPGGGESKDEGHGGGHGETKAAEEKKGASGSAGGVIHPLDTFIVNLADPARTRYLKVTVQLELDRQETASEVAARSPQVRDALIILLSSKGIEEISSPEGKYQLRDEIVARVNQFMTKGKVVTAYFTDLVVQ